MDSLIDSSGRKIDYVRISLTDRCNFRCLYCMPESGVEWLSHSDIMRYEDVLFMLRTMREWGIKKTRFTGGEPLVRNGIINFLQDAAKIDGLKIALTTNGALLGKFADELKKIGLAGINISIDTLDPEKFREITRGGELSQVLDGIKKLADGDGEISIKMNAVLMRGFNDNEIQNMLNFAHDAGILLRLIEFMPLDNDVWSQNRFISSVEVIERLGGEWQIEQNNTKNEPAGPARYYKNSANGQKIGIISAVSSHYCETCNRLRITANGKLRPCLFSNFALDIMPAVRERNAQSLREIFEEAIKIKPKIGVQQGQNEIRHMVQIGG